LPAATGGWLQTPRPLVRVSLTVIVEAGGQREQGSAGGGGRTDYGFFTDALLQSYAREAVHQAVTNLAARPAPAGTMTVVLGAGWPGILLHEAVGHGLEGDFNRKGSSTFAGRIGSRVAASGVTVIDDGTLAERRGSLNIDDEGNPTQRTVLIEDGILKGLHAGRSQRPFDGCRTHRQWPPGILCPPAAAADDQYHDVEW
jgi:TldD protein